MPEESTTSKMLYSSYYIYVLLVLLEMITSINGRPQNQQQINVGTANDSMATRKAIVTAARNKTKEERILNTNSQRGTISFGEYSEQDIIFPDSFELIFEPIPRIDGAPKCSDGSTFCENFDSYPYLHIKDILRRQEMNTDFFYGVDEPPIELEERVGADKEMFVCDPVNRIIFPKIGKNKNNKWKYIVNQGKDDGFIQGIRTETCRHEGGACNLIGELPNGFKTFCKQKYMYRRLLSLSENGSPIPDTFQLPSACCCSYKRDPDFLRRFGKPNTAIEQKNNKSNT